MAKNWLDKYLTEAVSRQLCTQIHCTTCGAREFRLGLLRSLAEIQGKPLQSGFDQENIAFIVEALAGIRLEQSRSIEFENAVRCLLADLWSTVPILNAELKGVLVGTWAGELLTKMFQDVSDDDLELLSDDEIRGGGAAMTACARLQFEDMSDYERKEIHRALLQFVELDTMAMVMI